MMARSQKILLKKPVGEDNWTFHTIGNVETVEVCSALLGALCTASQIWSAQNRVPPELIKELVNKELDKALNDEEVRKACQN